jgi:short-subunit dehydrogenase
MLARRRGVIVNVSSDSGRAPGPHDAAYGASKAALSAFTEALSFDTEGTGVHLHVLYPGWVPTAMGAGAVDAGMPMPPRMVRRTEEQVSQLLLARIGGARVDIDAAPIARLAPIGRAVFPGAYRKGVRKAGG